MAKWVDRADDLENTLNRSALWAVTYGDLMSYLMIFFLILFVSNQGQGSVQDQFALHAIEKTFGNENDHISEIFSEHGIQQVAEVEVTRARIRITLGENVMFDIGKARLKKRVVPHLIKLRAALKELPNPIQIEGHTDNIPLIRGSRYGNNWLLSSARAYAVLEIFIQGGIDPERLSGIGYGAYRPTADNETPEGRSRNRRIEINILRHVQ